MNLNNKTFIFLVISVIIVILINQVVWVSNMYKSYQLEYKLYIDEALAKAIKMEVTERMHELKGPVIMSFSPFNPECTDTGEYIQRKIQREDTTINIRIRKNDPNVQSQIFQFFLINDKPIRLHRLKLNLESTLTKSGFPVKDCYIEYIDLKKDSLIKGNKPAKWRHLSVVCTDTVPLDILKQVGVKAYVATSPRPILKKMVVQLGVSLIMIIIAIYGLTYLLQTIFRQRKLEKMRQDFVNAMVHEFKRPITNARTMLELIPSLLTKGELSKVERYATDSMTEFRKLTAYTERIQRISNNDSERIRLEKTDLPMRPFFEHLKAVFTEKRNKQVQVSLTIESKHEFMIVDPLHFSNVMENLMENSVKYSGDSVHIEVLVKDAGELLEISVKDNGFGISNLDKKLIFDKFYRGNQKEGKRTVGFGLGLTYVKAIVEAHGGTIKVLDASIKGSIFMVNIPT